MVTDGEQLEINVTDYYRVRIYVSIAYAYADIYDRHKYSIILIILIRPRALCEQGNGKVIRLSITV